MSQNDKDLSAHTDTLAPKEGDSHPVANDTMTDEPRNHQDDHDEIRESLFTKIHQTSLAEAVVEQIEELILSGVLPEQQRLPSERELAAQLDVSRPKVREALKILEQRQLITIQANSGVYVASLISPVMSQPMLDLYQRHPWAIQDHLEYRKEQEAFAARLAATRATVVDKEQIRTMSEHMSEAHQLGDHERGAMLDHAFHMAIVNASYNRTLSLMMKSLYEFNQQGVLYSRSALLNIDMVSATLRQQHDEIADAIIQGRPEEAEHAARQHIDFISNAVQQAFSSRQREIIARRRYLTGVNPS